MICEYIELQVDSLENRDLAKAMLKFWLYQSEQARQRYTALESKIKHARAANIEATEEWKDSFSSFSPILPFSEADISYMETQLPGFKKNFEEARHMAGYIINFITDKAHEHRTEG